MGPRPRRPPPVGASGHPDPGSVARPDRLGALRAAHQRQLPQVVPAPAPLERRDAVREVRRRGGRAPAADRRAAGRRAGPRRRRPRAGPPARGRGPVPRARDDVAEGRRVVDRGAEGGRWPGGPPAGPIRDDAGRAPRAGRARADRVRSSPRRRTREARDPAARRRPPRRHRARVARAGRRGDAAPGRRGGRDRPHAGHGRDLHGPALEEPRPGHDVGRHPQPPRRDEDAQVLLRPRVPGRPARRERVRRHRPEGGLGLGGPAVEERDPAPDQLRAPVRRRRPVVAARVQPRRPGSAGEPAGPRGQRPRDVPGLGVRVGRGPREPRAGPVPGGLRDRRGERGVRQQDEDRGRRHAPRDPAPRRAAQLFRVPQRAEGPRVQGDAARGGGGQTTRSTSCCAAGATTRRGARGSAPCSASRCRD